MCSNISILGSLCSKYRGATLNFRLAMISPPRSGHPVRILSAVTADDGSQRCLTAVWRLELLRGVARL